MKKFLVLILALLMALSLISCGDDAESKPAVKEDPIVEEAPQNTPVLEEAPKTEDAPIAEEAPKTEDAPTAAATPEAEDNSTGNEIVFVDKLPSGKTETVVEEYFKLNAQSFLAFVTDKYANASGSVCTSRLAAVGNTVTVDICIGSLNNISEETREQVQKTYTSFGNVYGELFEDLKKDIPELETMTINLCEEDGDLFATIKHGK